MYINNVHISEVEPAAAQWEKRLKYINIKVLMSDTMKSDKWRLRISFYHSGIKCSINQLYK